MEFIQIYDTHEFCAIVFLIDRRTLVKLLLILEGSHLPYEFPHGVFVALTSDKFGFEESYVA